MKKKLQRGIALLLAFSALFSLGATVALAAPSGEGTDGYTDAMPEIRTALGGYITTETQTIENLTVQEEYDLIEPTEITVLYDKGTHGEVVSGVRGTPIVLYVINTPSVERIGTDSDVDILTDLLSRGYVVAVIDYKGNAEAVSPNLDWNLQAVRTRLLTGEFFDGEAIPSDATYKEGYILPAGYNITNDLVYWSIDKHGADGTLDKIVEIWNNDFRSVKRKVTVKWTDEEDAPRLDKTEAIAPELDRWFRSSTVSTTEYKTTAELSAMKEAADASYKEYKYTYIGNTKAETITDCVKKDGSFIDLDLYMQIIYPTNPKGEVPVMCLASCGENAIKAWTAEEYPHLTQFLFGGYAGVLYDYGYVPMAREDHYAYYDGNASSGYITGDNQTYSIDVYNEKKTNTAALRYVRYLADSDDKYSFDVDALGVMGHSKAGVVTFLGAEHPELLQETRYFPGHHGETRYENGDTEDDGAIRGGEAQPWLTYRDGSEISSRAQFVYASAGSRMDLIVEGHSPTYLVGTMKDVAYYHFWPSVQNQCETYDVPCLYFRVEYLAHRMGRGPDKDYGVDTFSMLKTYADYWLKGDAAEVAYISPTDRTTEVSTSADITVKFTGAISAEEIEKVTVVNTETGKAAVGRWTSSFGGTEWTFTPDRLDGGKIYRITVPSAIVDATYGKCLASGREILIRTDYEQADIPTAQIGDAKLTKTESDGNKIYYTFAKNKASDTFKFSFRVNNDAHNIVNVYGITAIDAEDLAQSTLSEEPIATVNLSGIGTYTVDITDYAAAAGETVGICLSLARTVETAVNWKNDFEDCTVGSTKLPHDMYYNRYCDGEIGSFDGSNVYVVNSVFDNGAHTTGDGKSYDSVYVNNTYYVAPSYMLVLGGVFAKKQIVASDYGKTFHFEMRVYDTVSRNITLQIGEVGIKTDLSLADFKPMQYTYTTRANEWVTLSFDFTLDNPDYWNGLNKNKVTVMLAPTGDIDAKLYIDDITVAERVTDVDLAAAYLVSYPTESHSVSPTEQVSFDAEGNRLAESVIGGERLSWDSGAAKLWVKYRTEDLDAYAERNLASFHIAADTAGTVKIYGVTDTADWSADSLHYFNAVANDRFTNGVNPEKVMAAPPIATLTVTGTGIYSADISAYAAAMREAGAKTLTLLLTAENDGHFYSVTPVTGDAVFYDNYDEKKTYKRTWDAEGFDEFTTASDYTMRSGGVEYYPTLDKTVNATAFGSTSLRWKFGSSAMAQKFYNIFGKNLTAEDVGKRYTVSFRMTTDAESYTVRYGLMSATTKYESASGYTGDRLYNPLTGTETSANSELTAVLHKGIWTDVTFTFKVTEEMLGEKMNVTADGKTYHCNYALLAFLAGEETYNVSVYLDDLLVIREGEARTATSEYGKVTSWNFDQTSFKTVTSDKVDASAFGVTSETKLTTGVDENTSDGDAIARSTSAELSLEDHGSDGGKSLKISLNNKNSLFKLLNVFGRNLTAEDVGDTYKISFYVKSDEENVKFCYGFAAANNNYAKTSDGTYQYRGDQVYLPTSGKLGSLTGTAGTEWTKVSYTFKITSDMIGANMNKTATVDGEEVTIHCNYALFAFRTHWDFFNGTNGEAGHGAATLYVDDFLVERTDESGNVPKEGDHALTASEFATGASGGSVPSGTLGSAKKTENVGDRVHAYLTFASGAFRDTERAELRLFVHGAAGASLAVYGIKDPAAYDGRLTLDKTVGGAPLSHAVVQADGSVTFDVTSYVTANLAVGYGFAVVSEEASGISYLQMDLTSFSLTEGIDFSIPADAAALQDGDGLHISGLASGEGILLYNLFEEGNGVIDIGTHTVTVTLKNDGDTADTFILSLADKDGSPVGTGISLTVAAGETGKAELSLAADASFVTAGACALLLTAAGGSALTLLSVGAVNESTVELTGAPSLTLSLPMVDLSNFKVKSNLTLSSDLCYNLYVPVREYVTKIVLNGTALDLATLPTLVSEDTAYYRVTYAFAAKDAADSVTATVTVTTAEGEKSAVYALSIPAYAKKIVDGESYGDATKTLMKDMLAYIDAAMTYFDTTSTEKHKAITDVIGEDYVLPDDADVGLVDTLPENSAEAKETIASVALLLEDTPAFVFYLKEGKEDLADTFSFTSTEGAPLKVEKRREDGRTCLVVTTYAYGMNDTLTFTYAGGNGSYNLAKYHSGTTDEDLAKLTVRLAKYANSAKAYKAASENAQ